MFAECPKCKCPDMEYEETAEPTGHAQAFECPECRARFEIDPDYSYEGESWQDCSTPGKEITSHGR